MNKITVRLVSSDFTKTFTSPNKDFTKYLFEKNHSLLKSINIKFIIWNNDKKEILKNIFDSNKLEYKLIDNFYTYDKITIDVLKKEYDYDHNTSRFKIYYEDDQNSFIESIIKMFSYINALTNKEKVINDKEKENTSINNREQNLKKIRTNRKAYKEAKKKIQ